jgi:hypothetical protein
MLQQWIGRRRAIRRAWQSDARELIERDESNAYYNAQRLAARARNRKDTATAWHWAKVASEVARLSSVAGMDWDIVNRIAAEEAQR